jgi:hypothetical protein
MIQRNLIFIAILFSISLTVIGYMTWKDVALNNWTIISSAEPKIVVNPSIGFDFVYNVDSRFGSSITKEELDKAQSILDIVTTKDDESIVSYYNIEVWTFQEKIERQVKEVNKNEMLTQRQIQLLQSLQYGSSFIIVGNVDRMKGNDGKLVMDTLISYMTVLPEKPAAYIDGDEALITYLKENSKKVITIAKEDKLNPGKISFKVTEDGTVDQVELTYSSSYTAIDKKMIEVIKEIPGSWEIARNAKGEKVDQELVFFFGQIGC